MLVSRKTSALIGVVAAEAEAGGQRPLQRLQPRQRALAAAVAADLEVALAGDLDLDLVAFPQVQSLDDRGGETDRQRVAPFSDLHGSAPLEIYEGYCISFPAVKAMS